MDSKIKNYLQYMKRINFKHNKFEINFKHNEFERMLYKLGYYKNRNGM